MLPIPGLHDININITGNCNDCCLKDKCYLCCCKSALPDSPENTQETDKKTSDVASVIKPKKKMKMCTIL